jgi:hypothetical protein
MAIEFRLIRTNRQILREWLVLFVGPALLGIIGFLLFWSVQYIDVGTDVESLRITRLRDSLSAFGTALLWAIGSLVVLWRQGRLRFVYLLVAVGLVGALGYALSYWQ